MRVLGVDPGLTRCGLGVVETGRGRSVSLVDVSVAMSPADAEPADRLVIIADAVEAALDRFHPDAVAVERVFAQHNVRTVMGTAQVSGLVMVAARRRGIPVALYTPSEVKAAVSGSGRADKDQVGFMVVKLLGLDAVPTPADAADSLAIALTHALRYSATAGKGLAKTSAQQAWAEAEKAARRRG